MSEHLTTPQNNQELGKNLVEIVPVSPEETETQRLQVESERAETEATRTEAAGLALKEVHETQDAHELESLIENIDLSNANKYMFMAVSNPNHKHGASTTEGHLRHSVAMGDSYMEANDIENPHVVERAGIAEVDRYVGSTLRKVPRKGLAGKLGLKKWAGSPMRKSEEPGYVFSYAFASPRDGSEEARRAGHYTGQYLRLSVELTKEQATQLSNILAENPKAARQVLDGFVRATGDYGAWNAELYDDEGNFHDPDERYNGELLARDVRPNYNAIPDVEPQIVGLIGTNKETEPERFLPAV